MRYELKARTLSEILDGTFKLYSDNLGPFLTVSAVASIPVVACQLFLADLSRASPAAPPRRPASPASAVSCSC